MADGLSVRGAIAAIERDKKREYTPKQKKFLTLYAKNGFKDSKGCFEKAGYTPSSYHTIISGLKDDIKEIANAMLLGAAPEAAMTLTDILSSNEYNQNNSSKLAAAKEVLDRVGIVKKEEVQHNHNVSGGLFIIPAKMQMEAVEEEEEWIDGEYEDIDGEGLGSEGESSVGV